MSSDIILHEKNGRIIKHKSVLDQSSLQSAVLVSKPTNGLDILNLLKLDTEQISTNESDIKYDRRTLERKVIHIRRNNLHYVPTRAKSIR